MDLRTFLKPRPRPTAEPPRVGAPAPRLPIPAAARPRVVSFLRHVGCPFAEATLRALAGAAQSEPAVDFIAVSHGDREATERWGRSVGGAERIELLVDPARELYAEWGLGLTGVAHFAGARSLAAAIALARRGVRNRHPSGTRWQGAGTFAVDAGDTVRWRHLPQHAGDLPDLRTAAGAGLRRVLLG